MAELLRVEALRAGYGEAVVLDGVSFALMESQSLALLGRNGVGKTTLLRTLLGLTRLHGGTIGFAGRDITKLRPDRRAAAGIGWVPQERSIFKSLSVEENLTAIARPGAWTPARVFEMFPRLAERRANLGTQLSGGEQQMLAIGRALMLEPRLLILDEPSIGLAPRIVDGIFAVIRRVNAEGTAILLVEQNARRVLAIAAHCVVLENGRVAVAGSSAELLRNELVRKSYLGAH